VSYPVDPVLTLVVLDTTVKGVWSEDKEEVTGLADTLEEIVIELPCLQSLYVDEDREAAELEVDLQ